jgi:CHASE2 domain-containing sensor protein
MKRRVILWGLLASVACAVAQGLGWLDPLERWAYDVRARRCQWFMPAPDQRVVHVDVDDGTLKAQGMWPLHREVMAATIGELDRAGASAIGIDVLFDLPAPPRWQKRNDGAVEEVDDDALLEAAIRSSGKVVLAGDEAGVLPRFADAAAGVGSAKTVRGEDGSVRQVVVVEGAKAAGGKAKLGFALRLACVAEHVPAEGAVVEQRGVRLKLAGGAERFVPLTWNAGGVGVMQVPVFGTREWASAYDVPA